MSQNIALPSERLIWPASLWRWRYTSRLAPWISFLFLLGIFVDYGGTIYIKYIFGALALAWVAAHRHSLTILEKCKSDLLVLIVIPLVVGMAHVMVNVVSTGDGHLQDLYYALSSNFLLILLPLFYQTGGVRVIRQVRALYRVVAMVIVVVVSLHVLGILNVYETFGWMQEKGFGFVGIDPRQSEDVDIRMRPNVNLKIGHPLPLAFGIELVSSWLWAGVVALAVIFMMSRGLSLGLILACFLALIFFRRRRKRISSAKLLKIAVVFLVGTMVLATVFASQVQEIIGLVSHNIEEVLHRAQQAEQLEDTSTEERVDLIKGYLALVNENPLKILVGEGPGWVISTPMAPARTLAEMSVLNVALWFGGPYMLLYCSWLYVAAWRLWRLQRQPGYQLLDTGLLIGAATFWITGNFNPQMTSPLAIIAFMIIRTRILELSGYRPETVIKPI